MVGTEWALISLSFKRFDELKGVDIEAPVFNHLLFRESLAAHLAEEKEKAIKALADEKAEMSEEFERQKRELIAGDRIDKRRRCETPAG
jgi:hypothetical protein